MEYTRFGDKIQRRENADFEWEDVPEDDMMDARVELGVKEEIRARRDASGPPRLGLEITRSERNIEIAEKLGITGDQLAERLAKPDENQGTNIRVSEDEFDFMMAELGHSPEEARARFNGSYWTGGS